MEPIRVPLVGPAGEPVNFRATINSHGVASLPPVKPDGPMPTQLTVTMRLADGSIRTAHLSEASPGKLDISVAGSAPYDQELVVTAVRYMLRLDQDLSGFYSQIANDPVLGWVANGYGRMMRCQTVFEDVIKTVLTTNCAWSGTVRMVDRLVTELGDPDSSFAMEAPYGRAFPTPEAMAGQDESFYREVIRAGYRAPHLVKLANDVSIGALDLEAMCSATNTELSDDDLAKQLLALPGVGPYAASHIMHMVGRQSRVVLDSWTRPTYARLLGVESITDSEIIERHAEYGDFAGLAYWLAVTKEWFGENQATGEAL